MQMVKLFQKERWELWEPQTVQRKVLVCLMEHIISIFINRNIILIFKKIVDKLKYIFSTEFDIWHQPFAVQCIKPLQELLFKRRLGLQKLSNQARMDSNEDTAVQDFLEILEEHRKNCERQGKYVEAEIAKNRLEELKLHEENRRRVSFLPVKYRYA